MSESKLIPGNSERDWRLWRDAADEFAAEFGWGRYSYDADFTFMRNGSTVHVPREVVERFNALVALRQSAIDAAVAAERERIQRVLKDYWLTYQKQSDDTAISLSQPRGERHA